jgi:lauroyl/myristoyl acyltransferase
MFLREWVFRATRAVGVVLPLPILAALLSVPAFGRAAVESLAHSGRRPPRALPPTARSASIATELRERTGAWLNTAALLWSDRFTRPPWSARFDVSELDKLRAVIADQPAIIVTVHFGGIFVLPSLLRANGIPTAAVVGDRLWPVRWWRERRASLTQIDGLPAHLRSGDARAIVRYLQAGRCLLVAADYPLGEQIDATFAGGRVRLSTPSFRLARITGAALVPVIARGEGIWRYTVRVGEPVPDDLVAGGNDAAVLAHIVNQLLPIAATRPEQALPLLVNAFTSEPAA